MLTRTHDSNGRFDFLPRLPALHETFEILKEKVDVVCEEDGNGQVLRLKNRFQTLISHSNKGLHSSPCLLARRGAMVSLGLGLAGKEERR